MSKLIVDETKLIRKYSSHPLILKSHRWEKPYKEDLIELYINQNLTYIDLCSYFHIPLTCLIRILKYYNIKKDIKLIQKNISNTIKERYGVSNYSYSPHFLEKMTKTKMEKYGDPYYYNKEKLKKTCLERYGVDNISKSQYFKNKYKEVMFKKYGVEHYSQTENYPIKCKETMKKNRTYSTSKPENNILIKLLKYYPDTIHLYVDKERYPFECDFYIPSKDLFIEFQGTWLHGKYPFHEPYNPNNTNHQLMVNKWIEKSKNYNGHKNMYDRAIKVWTIKDPLKRETAQKNNLNWIEFFNEKDFDNWLKENNDE